MSKDKTKFVPGSVDLFKENIDKLKELFPQVVSDGEIDFEMLKSILDENLADSKEKYQFTWNGKSRTIKLAQTPSNATLLPSKKDSENWDATENLYIEGDNLEVLKLLQKTYFNKIKMIYIDPPYNTGGDFVYKDDFKDTIKNYKEQTEQTTRVNPETSGRYHTDWLNMMYSRLMLAKNLLSDDGVIFVSIDDNEVENLKKMMNEIFGENNFVVKMPRKTVEHIRVIADNELQKLNDYVLVFAKSVKIVKFRKQVTGLKEFPFSDEKGNYSLKSFQNSGAAGTRRFRPNLYYPIYYNLKLANFSLEKKDGYLEIFPKKVRNEDGRWLWSKEIFSNDKENLLFKNGSIFRKDYKKEDLIEFNSSSYKNWLDQFPNRLGSTILTKLSMLGVFDYAKPVELISFLINLDSSTNSIILDFFSGSATTAHAVMQLNAEDGGNRKFIMVQLPEKTTEDSEAFKAGYKNICEIGKERIRRAGELVKKDLIEKNTKLDKDEEKVDPSKLDIGFKVFKLEESNFKEWDSSKEPTIEQLELFADPIKEGKSEEDVLYEVLLKYGVFDQEVKKIKINNKDIYSISDNYLIVMLSNKITLEDVEEIKKLKPKIVIFRDSGFNGNDTIKINAFYTLTKSGVEEVKSV
jgi:adenine-specific DNA-methyltransferase